MGKFDKAKGSVDMINKVVKANNEKANVITLKMISNENLIDYKENNEDLKNTADLEASMKEQGFTDPMEVTAFGMEEGSYTILSGHRRRRAGIKTGITTFPCIVKTFNNENDLRNYVLFANSQRDSSKDPLLYCKRYKMHEEYLKSIGFKDSPREEIAKRLGISIQQADRYNSFNKIILPIWDMVRTEVVGMSNVLPMAKHTIEEQEEILEIFNECLEHGNKLTRDFCDMAIKEYRNGKKSYDEIFITEPVQEQSVKQESVLDSGLPLTSYMNTEPSGKKDNSERDRNNEVRREYDPYSYQDKDPYASERLTEDDYKTIEAVANSENKNATEDNSENELAEKITKTEKVPLTQVEKESQNGENIAKCLVKLEGYLSETYTFVDNDRAKAIMNTMNTVAQLMFDELHDISKNYDQADTFKGITQDLLNHINQFK